MKYKHLIVPLAIILVILLCIKHYQNVTVYPRSIRFERIDKNKEYLGSIAKIKSAVNDKDKNKCKDPLFFLKKGTRLNMDKKEFDKLNNNDSIITLNGKKVKCDIVYSFNKEDCLDAVLVQIKGKDVLDDYYNVLMKTYGNKYINVRRTYINENIWYLPDYYIYVEYENYDFSSDAIYITVCTYAKKDYRNLPDLVYYGGCYSSDFNKKEQKTYKYGDSDVYQGSSQQKADLKAIDDFFGF
jgi:hypothetical protein